MSDFSIYEMEKKLLKFDRDLLQLIAAATEKGEIFTIVAPSSEYDAAKKLMKYGLLKRQSDDFILTDEGRQMIAFFKNYELYTDDNAV